MSPDDAATVTVDAAGVGTSEGDGNVAVLLTDVSGDTFTSNPGGKAFGAARTHDLTNDLPAAPANLAATTSDAGDDGFDDTVHRGGDASANPDGFAGSWGLWWDPAGGRSWSAAGVHRRGQVGRGSAQ